MSDVKDPEIKLFGKTIQLPPTADCIQLIQHPPPPPSPLHNSEYTGEEEQESDKVRLLIIL